jgi:hypothetical protein
MEEVTRQSENYRRALGIRRDAAADAVVVRGGDESAPRHVMVVNTGGYDGIYVFEDAEQAEEFASRYDDASITEEVVLDVARGREFLVDTLTDSNT